MRFNTILDLTRQSRIDLGTTAQYEGSILLNENFTLQGNGYFKNIYTGSVNDSILSISSSGLVQKIQLEDKLALFLKAGTGINITSSPVALTITNTGVISFNGRRGLVVPASGDYNTDIVPEGFTNKYYTDSKVSTFINSISNIAGGLLKLNSNTKIDEIYLPRLAITEVFVVADITEMLTLTAQEGDVAKVLSNDTAYILKQEPTSNINNWVVISSGGSTDTLQTVMSRSNLTNYDLIFNGQNTISKIKNNNNSSSLSLQSNSESNNSASITLFGETSGDFSKSMFLNIGSTGSSISNMKSQTNGVSVSIQANSTSGSNKIFVLGIDGNLLLNDNFTSTTAFAQYKIEVKDLINPINGKFWGRVIGSNAVNNNEFLTLGQGDGKYSLLGHTHEWSTILNHPTKLSDFINDLGNYGNWITKVQGDTYYSPINHTHTFASITNKPTTLAGYGITDGVINSRTITTNGNGITGGGDLTANRTFSLDFTYLDNRYVLTTNLSNYYTKLESDGRYKPLSYVPTWSEILNKPTTISGYGITDTVSQLLNGFVVGSNTSILTSDSIVTAFGKVQSQINSIIIGSYTLPIASASVLGGVKIGSGLTINSSTGVLSSNPTDLSLYYTKTQSDARYLQSYVETDTLQTVTNRGKIVNRVAGTASISGGSDLVLEGSSGATAGVLYLNAYQAGDVVLGLGGGKVGVGISPFSKFQVLLKTDYNFSLSTGGSDANAILLAGINSANTNLRALEYRASYHNFAAGNVGIGTFNPLQKFVVSNNGATGIEFAIEQGSGLNIIQSYDRSVSAFQPLRLVASTLNLNSPTNITNTLSVTSNIFGYATEAFRIIADNGYISAYNTAGTIRNGFIQFTSGSLNIQSEQGSKIISIGANSGIVNLGATGGAVNIGVNGATATNLITYGSNTATSFIQSSLRSLKENIEDYNENAVDKINTIEIKSFIYKNDKDKNMKVGFIADDTDPLFSTVNQNTMDIGTTLAVALKAIQQLSKEINNLKEKYENK